MHLWRPTGGRRVRLTFTCASIALNALFGGGMYTFPLLTQTLSSRLNLSQPQMTTIVLAGMAGQYPFSALIGKIIDSYGPGVCSFMAAIFFSVGFSSVAWEIQSATVDPTAKSTETIVLRLTLYFALVGLGTVSALFSSLLSASKGFPAYMGTASSVSMALFGLSPTLLSVVASKFFTTPATGINPINYFYFLAISAAVVYLLGAFTLTIEKTPLTPADERPSPTENDEHSRLLPALNEESTPLVRIHEDSILYLIYDRNFWILALLLVFVLGSCEMIIANIGSIALSLPSTANPRQLVGPTPSKDAITVSQVRMISISNTLSRLVSGPLADYLGSRSQSYHHRVSRMAFIATTSFLLVLVFFYMRVGIESRESLWIISIGVGIAYGVTFNMIPTIVASIWGLANAGRNFGLVSYAPFVGTPLFSYLYAFNSVSQAGGELICEGTKCWTFTSSICMATSSAAFCMALILWKEWQIIT